MTKPIRTVQLEPMTEAEFDAWVEPLIAGYAQSHLDAGNWSAQEAPAKAREATMGLLPEGVATDGHHLWVARDEATGDRVGTLWIGLRPASAGIEAYVYFVEVDEDRQGEGYGRAVMNAGAEAARRLGAASIALNVFGDNTAACRLYDSLGYRVTHQSMRREL